MTPAQSLALRLFNSHPAYEEIARQMNSLLMGPPDDVNVEAVVERAREFSITVTAPLGMACMVIHYDQAAVELAMAPTGVVAN